METGCGALERERAANQESRADQQHQRQGQFGDDEAGPQAIAHAAGRGSPAPFFENLLHVGPCRTQRRREAGQCRAEQRHAEREREHDRAHGRLFETRHAGRSGGDEHAHSPPGERQSGSSGNESQDGALGEQLTHDASASGAERGSHRQLARARGTSRQQKVGDVAARDEEHEPDGSEHDEEAASVIAHELIHRRRHLKSQLRIVEGKLHLQIRGVPEQLSQRLLHRRVRLEPAVGLQVVLVVRGLSFRGEGNRDPQLLGPGREIEMSWHDADDFGTVVR